MNNTTNGDNSTTTTTDRVANILGWVSFSVGLPAIGLALFVIIKLVKAGKPPPLYVISLLISDILNIFGRPIANANGNSLGGTLGDTSGEALKKDIPSLIFYFGIISNIVFLVCVAQERHLLVAFPQCSIFCSKVKQSALISLGVWALPVGIVVLAYYGYFFYFSVSLLVPLPLLLFFFIDSGRALLCSPSVAVVEKKRIIGAQALILCNYCILYLPFIVNTLLYSLDLSSYALYLGVIANLLLYLGPLVDPFLSMFLTKRFKDVLDVLCCCKRKTQREEDTVSTVSGYVTKL